jgi:hypothetical protein
MKLVTSQNVNHEDMTFYAGDSRQKLLSKNTKR